ncbi:hypothetical protein ACFV3R_08830 [Streptomyces sp. NPDC059740]|uniref:hypothetical protein n=1 Tax=Streptomyces sp. NPDC059740 TaxID=3346926 RepID=UPI00365E140A
MSPEEAAEELYGLPPEDFTAAREERARAARSAGDRSAARAIRALRRPTYSAWAANLLTREEPDRTRGLLELGAELRDAQRRLDGPRLRELMRAQRELTEELTRSAARIARQAGHPLGEGALREVEQTLRAALADPDAARRWRAGCLPRPLTAPSDLDATAVAGTEPGPRPPGRSGGGQVVDLATARARRRGHRSAPSGSGAQEGAQDTAGAREEENTADGRPARARAERGRGEDGERPEPGQDRRRRAPESAGAARTRRRARELREQARQAGDEAARADREAARAEAAREEAERAVEAAEQTLRAARARRDAARAGERGARRTARSAQRDAREAAQAAEAAAHEAGTRPEG